MMRAALHPIAKQLLLAEAASSANVPSSAAIAPYARLPVDRQLPFWPDGSNLVVNS